MKNYIVLLCSLQLRKRLGVSESNLLLLAARNTTTMPSTHNTKLMKFTKIAFAFLSLATALQLVDGERLRLEDHKREQAEEGYMRKSLSVMTAAETSTIGIPSQTCTLPAQLKPNDKDMPELNNERI